MEKENYLGERLKKLRESHYYSQQYVADYLHIIRQTYSHYETGRLNPPAGKIAALANLYEMNPQALMDWDEEKTQQDEEKLTSQEQYLLYHFRKLDKRDRNDIVLFAEIKSGERGRKYEI